MSVQIDSGSKEKIPWQKRPRKKRATIESIKLKIQKVKNRVQTFRGKLDAELQNKLERESEDRVRDLMENYYKMIRRSGRHVIIENYFTSEECNSLKIWMKSVSPTSKLESINFPAGQPEFDSSKTKFSEVNEEHRFQSMQLITAEIDAGILRFQPGEIESCGKTKKQIQGMERLTKQAFSLCPTFLKDFISAIFRAENRFGYFVVKSLISYPGGGQQWFHCDDAEDLQSDIISRSQVTYSIIVALEPDSNETFILGAEYDPADKNLSKPHRKLKNENEMKINQGGFIIIRGDYPHSGASYGAENWRLHIAITPSKERYDGSAVGWISNQPEHLITLKTSCNIK